MITVFLGIYFLFLCMALINLRIAVIIFVSTIFLTPKGLALLDIPQLPYLSFNRAMVLALLLGCGFRILLGKNNSRYYIFNLDKSFIALAFAYLSTYFFNFDDYPGDFVTLFISYFEIFLPCYLVSRYLCYKDIIKLSKIILFFTIFSSIYGIFTYIIKFNPYFEFLKITHYTDRVLVHNYEETVRGLRSTSFFSHPITYGGFLGISFFYLIFYFYLNNKNKIISYAFSFLILLAVFYTNSRTPLIQIFIGLFIIWLFSGLFKKIITSYVVAVALVVLSLFYQDYVFDFLSKFSSFVNLDVGDENAGSTLGMRLLQFGLVYILWLDNPVFGSGISHLSNIVESGAVEDLYNLESALFVWLLSLGLVGLIFYIVLFVNLLRWARHVMKNNFEFSLYFALFIGYIFFIMSTGVMDTMQYFLIVSIIMFRLSAKK